MNERLLIIGAGAIGCLAAGQLALAGQPVTLAGRPAAIDAIRRRGLRLSQGGQTQTVTAIETASSLAEAFAGRTRYGLAILAVKSYDTDQVLAELTAATASPPPLLTLQNGVGNEQALASALGQEQVIAGTILAPVRVAEPGHVIVEKPRKRIGLADLATQGPLKATQAAQRLAAAGFETQVYEDWHSLKWSKLILNLLCNASCALLDWTPERVWADRRLAALEIAAWREAMAAMDGLGCRLVNMGGYPLAWLAPLLRRLPIALLHAPLGHFVIEGRGGKMPSLHGDLSQGKRRSEVGWLNGAVAKAGRSLGLATPANNALLEALTAVVHGNEPWARYQGQPERLLARWQEQTAGQEAVDSAFRQRR